MSPFETVSAGPGEDLRPDVEFDALVESDWADQVTAAVSEAQREILRTIEAGQDRDEQLELFMKAVYAGDEASYELFKTMRAENKFSWPQAS